MLVRMDIMEADPRVHVIRSLVRYGCLGEGCFDSSLLSALLYLSKSGGTKAGFFELGREPIYPQAQAALSGDHSVS
jgi:hypothetical protein